MTGVDVFGRASINSSSVFKIQSNGGLTLNTDFVAVKVDRNANNILSLSANGLMANGIKCTGGAMTGNLDMGGNQIPGLEMTYPIGLIHRQLAGVRLNNSFWIIGI